MLYIKRMSLSNITCFEQLDLEFEHAGASALFLGDNGDGKSTVLRCLAIGLCDSSSAAALLRELSGPFVRRMPDGPSPEIGSIEIDLVNSDGVTYRITTEIKPVQSFEEVSQKLNKIEGRRRPRVAAGDFPWDDIFVVGYGAGLRTGGTEPYEGYVAPDAVYTLFSYEYPLQNPELIIRRLIDTARQRAHSNDEKEENERSVRTRIQGLMSELLGLNGPDDFLITSSGLAVRGFWGTASLHQLGDGYQATITWVLDLISWWFMREGIDGSTTWDLESIEGVVIIDEIEQHLHPKWQYRILPTLIERFPRVQFIVATHSPLVASSAKDVEAFQFRQGRQLEEVEPYGWLPQEVLAMMDLPEEKQRSPRFVKEVIEPYKDLDYKRLRGTATEAELRKWRELSAELARLKTSDPIGMTLELRNIMRTLDEGEHTL